MAATFSVTLVKFAQGPNPAMSLSDECSRVELVESVIGGYNDRGEFLPGGWDTAICNTCGEPAEWCPELSAVLGLKRPTY